MGIPTQYNDASFDKIFRILGFAHELGHVIQSDVTTSSMFGTLDSKTRIPEDDYLAYVRSDKERNADYIAASVIGSTNFGLSLGIEPPKESPDQWREWADKLPI